MHSCKSLIKTQPTSAQSFGEISHKKAVYFLTFLQTSHQNTAYLCPSLLGKLSQKDSLLPYIPANLSSKHSLPLPNPLEKTLTKKAVYFLTFLQISHQNTAYLCPILWRKLSQKRLSSSLHSCKSLIKTQPTSAQSFGESSHKKDSLLPYIPARTSQ